MDESDKYTKWGHVLTDSAVLVLWFGFWFSDLKVFGSTDILILVHLIPGFWFFGFGFLVQTDLVLVLCIWFSDLVFWFNWFGCVGSAALYNCCDTAATDFGSTHDWKGFGHTDSQVQMVLSDLIGFWFSELVFGSLIVNMNFNYMYMYMHVVNL